MIRILKEKLSISSCVPENCSGTHVFLSLGSNLGKREEYLQNALLLLEKGGFSLLKVSSSYETDPVGCEKEAGKFLNIAVEGIWKESAFSLLALCQNIEILSGRPACHAHWVSRVLDIDIILFGEEKIHTEELTVPHPLALQRRFVMEPLAEIAPFLIFPGEEKNCCQIKEELAGKGF